MKTISRNELKAKIDNSHDVKVIEVLSPEYFQKQHLPGAINIPYNSDNFDQQIKEAVPDKEQPVVVYCANKECQASPKAAHKLDELGYSNVYDYEEGKADWEEAGLLLEK